ncbi:MAG: hypothetical protein ABI224_03500 [Acetobacteraceae bacterium]
MSRVFMIVVAGGLVVLVGGFVALGTFPPTPSTHQVEKTLPNDGFHAS